MQAVMMSPMSPLEAGGEMYQRNKTNSFFQARPSTGRPLSEASDTDFEDDSEFEEDFSPAGSSGSDDGRRRSQTTISSFDEVPTPSSAEDRQPFEIRIKPVEGPKGPHLFRASVSSADFAFDHALQMSPVLAPKLPPARTETAFSDQTLTPVTRQREADFSIDSALNESAVNENDNWIRSWSSQQVIDWMYSCGLDASVIECFEIHDVDGAVILDLSFEDLKELDIQSFGKRHQLWNAICDLRGLERGVSPTATPFQDTSRPCTAQAKKSPNHSRNRNVCQSPIDDIVSPLSPTSGKKRRGRKAPKELDIISPAESVSIVAIEQLLPKPHKCAKGERCAKWRKQQRELQQLKDDNAIGRFPISPTKGGRIYVQGDPGNAMTADKIIPNVRLLDENYYRPQSESMPSVVASSDLMGPGQLPEFALHADKLEQLDKRDPQDNVRQFLNFQHINPSEEAPPSPSFEMYSRSNSTDPVTRSGSVPLFPQHHHQPYSSSFTPSPASGPHEQLRTLPRLDIPRSASAAPRSNTLASPEPLTAISICRSEAPSPINAYRLSNVASEMDVPLTAVPLGPVARDTSQSVPPNMQFRQGGSAIARSKSRTTDPRRPAKESLEIIVEEKARDPMHHSPQTQHFGLAADYSHAGWMKKRKTKLLRHEWTDQHCRLTGTQLALHDNSRLTSVAKQTIDVDQYAVACSSVASGGKLAAAMKALNISHASNGLNEKGSKASSVDPTAFAFQLIPDRKTSALANAGGANKTHHFAVKTKDERIDWMRELMLAKALQQKGKGYSVEINGVEHK
ncbi:Hypothetical protein R9X50_00396000 [Acrodontium crateriforme]|uniref:SAM and PH domain-containing protein n=1 Tax=Acrodontium crateriforme TaxID=150365 RepID=A0AAQ3RAB6_9PEZI|nr:Hypothetical protein R9X50_00396000 [Acrodontium crateriforme]